MDLLCLIAGFIAGIIATAVIFNAVDKPKQLSGRLKIDFSNIDNNICELEFCEDINSIYTKQYITLSVETNDFTQK